MRNIRPERATMCAVNDSPLPFFFRARIPLTFNVSIDLRIDLSESICTVQSESFSVVPPRSLFPSTHRPARVSQRIEFGEDRMGSGNEKKKKTHGRGGGITKW